MDKCWRWSNRGAGPHQLFWGEDWRGNVQVSVTIVKVALIAAIIVIGLGSGHGTVSNFSTSIAAPGGIADFSRPSVAALWAYDGWNNGSMVSSEEKYGIAAQSSVGFDHRHARGSCHLSLDECRVLLCAAPPMAVASTSRVAGEMDAADIGSARSGGCQYRRHDFDICRSERVHPVRIPVPFRHGAGWALLKRVGFVHPKHRTPSVSILALSAWACLLVLSGRYDQLYTYVIFASVILYGMATAAVIVLRFKRPDMPRPYRVIGYPYSDCFRAGDRQFGVSTLLKSPRESLIGLGLISLGLPFYFYWKKRPQA